jgi:hypothetical protein
VIDGYEDPATIDINELLELNPEESKKEVRQD